MKRMLLGMIAICISILFANGAFADERIVFVNMERIFEEYDKTKLADTQLKKQAGEFADERKKMIDEATALRDEFNELRAAGTDEALSEEARQEKKVAAEEVLVKFRKMEQEINEFNKLRAKQLEDQGKRMRENIVEEITATIVRHARNNGYISVVDSSAQSINAIDTVLYVDSRYDITNEIIGMLNEED